MNQTILDTIIYNSAGLPQKQVESIIETFLNAIKLQLEAGETVQLRGFGTFSVHETKARVGRNPRTGEPIDIAAGFAVKFKPSKALKEIGLNS